MSDDKQKDVDLVLLLPPNGGDLTTNEEESIDALTTSTMPCNVAAVVEVHTTDLDETTVRRWIKKKKS